MLQTLEHLLSYPFVSRALVVGTLVSLCAALLGVSLVLKRYSMIGDGLSHVGFGALSVAMALGIAPMIVSVPVVSLTAFALLRLGENSRLRGDAAVALVSSGSLAVGVIVTSLAGGSNSDVYAYMFGSILALSQSDLILSVLLCGLVLLLFILFYHRIFAITFDETFARATGLKTGIYNSMLALLTAITVVVGMRLMGALLISSLILFPALSSMRICKSFRSVVLCAAGISIVCFLLGMVVSFLFSTPAGASVVVVNLLVFLCCAPLRTRGA